MGCCQSTCLLHGRHLEKQWELETVADLEPLVNHGSAGLYKTGSPSTSRAMQAQEVILEPCRTNSVPAPGRGITGCPPQVEESKRFDVRLQPIAKRGDDDATGQSVNVQAATSATSTAGIGNNAAPRRPPLPAGLLSWPSSPPQQVQREFYRLQYRDVTPEDYDLLCLLDEIAPKRLTAPQSIVATLPNVLARDCGTSQCQICLAEINPQVRVVQLPCGHGFHRDCITRWMTQCRNSCPLCSSQICSASKLEDLFATQDVREKGSVTAATAGSQEDEPAHEPPRKREQIIELPGLF
mmetsp:Transcript_21817/g.40145  ORF Transcript_21817/g.40145 Transcript_21817/m.40145 type:complete len:296 (-) Transcript_21817:86-973(-)